MAVHTGQLAKTKSVLSQNVLATISTVYDIDSTWEYFHKSLFSCAGLSIPVWCCPIDSLGPGTLNPVARLLWSKQLAFTTWKADPSEGNFRSFHKVCNKHTSILSQAGNNLPNLKAEFSNQSPSSKSWSGLLKSLSGVYFPSISTLTTNDITADCPS